MFGSLCAINCVIDIVLRTWIAVLLGYHSCLADILSITPVCMLMIIVTYCVQCISQHICAVSGMCLHSCSYAVGCHNNTRTCKDFNVVFTLFSTQFSVPSADTTYWCTQHYLHDIIKDINTNENKIYFYKVLRHNDS